MINPYTPKSANREPVSNAFLEPDTAMISALDQGEDDFRLTVSKMDCEDPASKYKQQLSAKPVTSFGTSAMIRGGTGKYDRPYGGGLASSYDTAVKSLGFSGNRDLAYRLRRY